MKNKLIKEPIGFFCVQSIILYLIEWNKTTKNELGLGRGGGQVVSMLAYYSDDPTSIPAEAYIFSVKLLLKSTKIKKRPGLTQKKGENGPMLASFSIAFRLFNMSQFKYVAFFFYSKSALQKRRPYPTSVKSILLWYSCQKIEASFMHGLKWKMSLHLQICTIRIRGSHIWCKYAHLKTTSKHVKI